MNTMRFFLLLISLFLFSLIFHTQNKTIAPGVLSEKSNSPVITSAQRLRYPNATINRSQSDVMLLTTADSPYAVYVWYKNVFSQTAATRYREQVEKKVIRLFAVVDKQPVDIVITKKENKSQILLRF